MKKDYQQPKTQIIDLGTEAQLCTTSNQGEGNGDFDVKRENVWASEGNSRSLWDKEW